LFVREARRVGITFGPALAPMARPFAAAVGAAVIGLVVTHVGGPLLALVAAGAVTGATYLVLAGPRTQLRPLLMFHHGSGSSSG
jgi:hypothetical protein